MSNKKSQTAKSPDATLGVHAPDATKPRQAIDWGTAGLIALVAQLGDASREEVEALVGKVPRESRIAEGRTVATTRIDEDGERIGRVAGEFLSTIPENSKDDARASVDIGIGALRVIMWSVLQGHLAYRELVGEKVVQKGDQKALGVTAGHLTGRLRLQRDKLATLIRNASGQDPAVNAKVKVAETPAASGAVDVGPDASIHSLVSIGRDMVTKSSATDKKRFEHFGFTEEKLSLYEAAATEAGPTLRAAGAPAAKSTVSQAEVDFLDGTNLLLLELLVDAFKTAAALDHRVPELPVVSLRGILTGHGKGPAAPVDQGPVATTAPGTATPPTR